MGKRGPKSNLEQVAKGGGRRANQKTKGVIRHSSASDIDEADPRVVEAAKEAYEDLERRLGKPETWDDAKKAQDTFGKMVSNFSALLVAAGTAKQFLPIASVRSYIAEVNERAMSCLVSAARLISNIDGITEAQRQAFLDAHGEWVRASCEELARPIHMQGVQMQPPKESTE